MGGNSTARSDTHVNNDHGRQKRRFPIKQMHLDKFTMRKPLWAAMAAQTLSRRDPRVRLAAAELVVAAELQALREAEGAQVWKSAAASEGSGEPEHIGQQEGGRPQGFGSV